ncbi:hypothetical protein GGI23_005233, partial [Coemansia sp. RSA 2559]
LVPPQTRPAGLPPSAHKLGQKAPPPPPPPTQHCRPAAANNVSKATVPGSPPAAKDSKTSERSAKAQAAANMLTDVLRQLSKSDAPRAGTVERNPPLPANRVSDTANRASHARGAVAGNNVPLDAKVAELEKLIIDLHRGE